MIPLTPRADSDRSIRAEIAIVLTVTLGTSGLSALVALIETQIKTARAGLPLSSAQVPVVASRSTIDAIDLLRQLLAVGQYVAWGLLAVYLLWRAGVDLSDRIGLDLRRPGRDAVTGLGLAALIGIPGLGLYLAAHALGVAVTVQASTLTDTWWRVPVSVLIAVENGFLEEVLVIGYLLTRLGHLRVRPGVAVGLAVRPKKST